MKNITLKTIQEVTNGRLYNAPANLNEEVTAIVHDSRKIIDNCIFLCIKGERFDGHEFAHQALEVGAMAVISERRLPNENGTYLLVDSVLDAVQQIAALYRRNLGIPVVGITGSVGKTSTKEFVSQVLSQKYNVHKTKGNYNNQWGVPFTIFEATEKAEVMVLEMGISNIGEMDELSRIARPDIAVITNIGESHLEFFKTRDGILQAKSEIFKYMDSNGTIILNGDDDKLATITGFKGIKPVFYGLSRECNVIAENIVDKGLEGTEFDLILRSGGGKLSVHLKLPVPGMQNIYNALAAIEVGLSMNLSLTQVKSAIENMKNPEGRGNIKRTQKYMILDDCYNASPKSVESSLNLLSTMPGRKVAILGDMLELGENSDKLHFRVGKYAGQKNIDLIVCVGALSEKIYMGARMNSKKQVEYYKTRQDFLAAIPKLLKSGDSVLVKASNAMGFSQIVDELRK